MNKFDELLEYTQKTNPGMTRERLLEELSASTYTSKAILFTHDRTPEERSMIKAKMSTLVSKM